MNASDFPIPLPLIKVGGRLKFFYEQWRKLPTVDELTLRIISEGLIILLHSPVPRNRFQRWERVNRVKNPGNFSEAEIALEQKIQDELNLGAITQVTDPTEISKLYLSRTFTVPKKGGSWRKVLDCRPLNASAISEHFKMETLSMVRQVARKNDYMVKIDIQDAYLHVPLHPQSKNLLAFASNGRAYRYNAMAFGYNRAPRTFTKVLRPVVAFLREQGVRCIIYLDDIIIFASTLEEIREKARLTVKTLTNLGFLINWPKSCLTPSTSVEFLGFEVDTAEMMLRLPQDKVRAYSHAAKTMLRKGMATAREMASLTGKLGSTAAAVEACRMHLFALETWKIKALRRSGDEWEAQFALTDEVNAELTWWIDHLDEWNGKGFIPQPPSLVLQSDSSQFRWGATCNGVSICEDWSQNERNMHINAKELQAGLMAVKAFALHFKINNATVLLEMDNTTAVSYVNKMGGTKSKFLCDIAHRFLAWTTQRGIRVTARHLPGVANTHADALSRSRTDLDDWMIHPEVFSEIEEQWGPHTIDLFATRLNTQLPRFYSRYPDPECSGVDAILQDWTPENSWANPPWPLIPLILQKVRQSGVTMTLIAPIWPSAFWFPELQELAIRPPIAIRMDHRNFLPMNSDVTPRPLINTQWQLAAWRVCGRR